MGFILKVIYIPVALYWNHSLPIISITIWRQTWLMMGNEVHAELRLRTG